MSLSRAELLRPLRTVLRRLEFLVSKRFALSTREDRFFFALVPTVGLVAGGLAVLVQRRSEWLRVLLWGYTPNFEFAVRAGLSGWRVLLTTAPLLPRLRPGRCPPSGSDSHASAR